MGVPLAMQVATITTFLERHGGGRKGFRPIDIPAVPPWRHNTSTERLLLTATLPDADDKTGFQRSFEAWWDFIVPPARLVKWRWDGLRTDPGHLRLAYGAPCTPGIRWVVFDPAAYQGVPPRDALVQSRNRGVPLAHLEVLAAAAQFSDWIVGWNGQESPYPSLSGCQIHWDSRWADVPYLIRFDGLGRLGLRADRAGIADAGWSSPTARPC